MVNKTNQTLKSVFFLHAKKDNIDKKGDTLAITKRLESILKSTEISLRENIQVIDDCEAAFKNVEDLNSYDLYIVRANETQAGCYSDGVIQSIRQQNDDSIIIKISDHPLKATYYPKQKIIEIPFRHLMNDSYHDAIVDLFLFILEPPTYYISYGNEENTNTPTFINKLIKALRSVYPHINIKQDKLNLKMGDIVNHFLENLKKSDNLIIILNDKYFESSYCMEEFLGVMENSDNFDDLNNRIYLITKENAEDLYGKIAFQKRYAFWKTKLKDSANDFFLYGANLDSLDELKIIIEILQRVLLYFEKNIRYISYKKEKFLENENFYSLISLINKRIKEKGFTPFYCKEVDIYEILNNKISVTYNVEINLNKLS